MSPAERGLLQAIFDDIDDDTPRLVYADFLEERGDPRGEFIRLQVIRHQRGDHLSDAREDGLLAQHFKEWTRAIQPFDAARVLLEFERGFIAKAEIHYGSDRDLAVLERLPGLCNLNLVACRISSLGVRHIAALPNLCDLLFDSETTIRAADLHILEALPCWTRIRCLGSFQDEVAWLLSEERRIAKFDQLPPRERRRVAERFLRIRTGNRPPFTYITGSMGEMNDSLMRFLGAITELEHLGLYLNQGLTDAGLRHLAGMPNLKRVDISDVSSIRPLTECPALEALSVLCHTEPVLDDKGTEGLDRLTNLRTLHLASWRLGDATIQRLRPLHQLQELTLNIWSWKDERCMEALSNLTNLKKLSLNAAGDQRTQRGFSDDVLRYLAPLEKLQSLAISLRRGEGHGLRHLAGLAELRFLHLSGPAVTDAGLRHLAPLRYLRTLLLDSSAITEAGARALAEQLQDVTIITNDHVTRSPCTSMMLRRRSASKWASVLLPADWSGGYEVECSAREYGWEDVPRQWVNIAGPAEIQLAASEERIATTVEATLEQQIRSRTAHGSASVQVRDLIRWPGWTTSSCIYQDNRERHLLCVAARGERVVSLDCSAPSSRFEELCPLFLFVAHSVQLGEDAQDGIGERIEVPVSAFKVYAS